MSDTGGEFDSLEFLLDLPNEEVSSNGGSTGSFYEASEEVPDPDPTSEIDPGPILVGDGQCKICFAPTWRPPGLTKTGRLKRAPVYCDIHNPKTVRQRGTELSGPELDAALKSVQTQLADELMLFAMALGTFFPVTGAYMAANADAVTGAVLQLSKDNTRVMRLAHRLATIAPVYTIGRYAGGVFTSFQVDNRKHDPHSRVAMHLGVSEAYDAIYANTSVSSSPSNGANSMFTGSGTSGFNGPPRYAAA